ncbi:MAG: DUF1643 domain-containing protein [Candidatus Omnitrophica bacterium]|nr:DUF1643 domain-containing protein [Candidatus Omnitrophota bacterium]
MYDLYKSNYDDSVRYILGKDGSKKMFVIGLNPSTASKEKSDITVSKVERVAKNNNYNGFVMLNLYPLRSTIPIKLPYKKNDRLIEENLEQIINMVKKESEPHFWAAWGHNITLRDYFLESLNIIYSSCSKLNAKWFNFGDLTNDGHPRHPSRLSYSWMFEDFNVIGYLSRFNCY